MLVLIFFTGSLKVYAVADGYVSRIKISTFGTEETITLHTKWLYYGLLSFTNC
jgi:hypothetical protein